MSWGGPDPGSVRWSHLGGVAGVHVQDAGCATTAERDLPPPSITMRGPVVLTILAGRVSVMVTGSGPQLKVMTPPRATPCTTASPCNWRVCRCQ